MKKQWISVKCGLSRDPKHRQAMGEGVWLFLHILDIASWEDGIVHDWKDEAAAEDMGMPVRTLREHRRKLAELDYITCLQKQYTQDIIIHNWTNPREYNGQVYNEKQGDRKTEAQDYTQGDIQGSRKDVTPTLDSKNQIPPMPLEWQIMAGQKNIVMPEFENREKSAIDAFEQALNIPANWNWYPAKSTEEKPWKEFRAYLVGLYEADPQCFVKYAQWRRKPFAKGAVALTTIKRDPAIFASSWAEYLASETMYGSEEKTRLL